MRVLRITTGWAVLLVTSGGLSGGQMSPQMPLPQNPGFPNPGTHGAAKTPDDPDRPNFEEQQALARNNERQKKLVADTDKLLALATDLKEQVNKTNKDILSVDVIKKAEEIEKLAHSVKERMKG